MLSLDRKSIFSILTVERARKSIVKVKKPQDRAWIIGLLMITSGCAGGGGGSGATPSANLSASSATVIGYSGNLNEAVSNQFLGLQEFANVSYYGISGGLHPYTLTNVHQAYGYGLSGKGQTIAILDSGFVSREAFDEHRGFAELQVKYDQGLISMGDSVITSNWHGAMVSSLAAAPFNNLGADFYSTVQTLYPNAADIFNAASGYYSYGSSTPLLQHGMLGVAFNARLMLSDLNVGKNGANYNPLATYARATNAAASQGAVVQNNSWGLGDGTRTVLLPTSIPANLSELTSTSVSEYLASVTNYAASDWLTYFNSLKSFQSRGVVVFALQNTSDAQPSLMAALPQVYRDLQGSWIAVGNIESSGSLTNPRITLQSSACGAAAAYCLMADGTGITGANLSNNLPYLTGQTGASFAAPQVSGMVALLAEAFPSLRPDQLATRLFATANNRFFSVSATKDFGNGVSHGYNNKFGHGIPDMYAALRPIGSVSVVLNGSPENGTRVPLAGSSFVTSPAYGTGLAKKLSELRSEAYDSLGAPFALNLGKFARAQIRPSYLNQTMLSKGGDVTRIYVPLGDGWNTTLSRRKSLFELGSALTADIDEVNRGIRGPQEEENKKVLTKDPKHKLISKLQKTLWQDRIHTDGFMQSPMQFAASFSSEKLGNLIAYTGHSNNKFALQGLNPNVFGLALQQQFAVKPSNSLKAGLTLGFQVEDETVRGAQANGALALGSRSRSYYLAPEMRFRHGSWHMMLGGSLGITKPNTESARSMIVASSAFLSSEFYASAVRAITPRLAFFTKAWQPETIESAEVTIALPGLTRSDQPVPVSYATVSMATSSRPLVVSAGFQHQLSPSTTFTQEAFASQGLGASPNEGGRKTDLGLNLKWQRTF